MSDRITIFDTTLRDGEQAPGFSMTFDQKIQMAKQLERLGVDVIEAGFPIASEGDFESVKQISKELKKTTIAGLARTTQKDIDRAWDALKYAKHPRIHTFVATSDIHLEHKLKKSRDEVLAMAVEAVKYAKNLCDEVEFSAEDAVRSDIQFLCQVIEAVIDAGAKVVNIPDTVGYSIPVEFGEIIRTITEKVPNIHKAVISVHCHNDLGLGVANSLAAIQNGARQVECTINGIGERAGNASLEEFVMVLRTRKSLLDLDCNINTREIYRSSQLLSNLTGIKVQRNKAIVGENAFAHEAGIHQDGMLKNPQTYEIMTPESVGISESSLVLGKHSGRHALTKRYKELGYELSKSELDKAYQTFTHLADKKKLVYDADLIAIVRDEISKIPEAYLMESVQVLSGSHLTPTATVRLKINDEVYEDSAIGDGPVDAACKAIDRITNISGKLVHYSIQAVTIGKDAMGEVLIKLEHENRQYNGQAASTDVIEASAKAYLSAVNRIIYTKGLVPTQEENIEQP
ncbi:2-isopropylmalate synthase [candidate division KSB1 bacterium]|nr:2-isopropylmalate synthase [candidate division KSB1 bacterium]